MTHLEHLLIVTLMPDGRSRAVLREVLAAEIFKGETIAANSNAELFEKLRNHKKTDLVIVGHALGSDELNQFLTKWKENGCASKHGLVIAIRKQGAEFAAGIANSYLSGVDGFIKEPYSSTELRVLLSTVLETVKKRRLEAKAKAIKACRFLLPDAASMIDDRYLTVVSEGTMGIPVNPKTQNAIASSLTPIYNEFPEEYFHELLSVFGEHPIPEAHTEARLKRSNKRSRIQPPGRVAASLMESRSISRDKVISIMKISNEELDRFLAGDVRVTEALARDLSRALGKTAREWTQLQNRWDEEAKK